LIGILIVNRDLALTSNIQHLTFVLITEFDYELPPELIAQHPLASRDASRMLVVDRSTGQLTDLDFSSLPSYLRPGDVLVLNNTKVLPARLIGRREGSSGRVEIFLVNQTAPGIWEALSRPARRLQKGARVVFDNGRMTATVLEVLDDGHRLVGFETDGPFDEVIDEIGRPPLPPYIKRDEQLSGEDRERYQTVFARFPGAIAAPTAGLHFTPELLQKIKAEGAKVAEITLHVGYGTFEPVRVKELSGHSVGAERFDILPEAAEIINAGRREGGRIVAVGTTTTRALESAASEKGTLKPGSGMTGLTITPGYRFRAVDAMLTNFHLPQSSLLVLVASFAGYNLTMNAYRHAVNSKYRFYSYGDCMLII